MKNKDTKTKQLVLTAMLSAVAYVVMVIVHLRLVPAAPFLTYDPKDAIIVIGGFIFGPVEALLISLIVSFIEMITISDTGIIGFVMQVIATLAFAGTASVIYRRKHTRRGAVIGLITGTLCMTVVMLLWNYILSPIYMNAPRSEIVKLLVPAILPFNFLKGLLNSAIAFIIYKPVVTALRKSGLAPSSKTNIK